ncbi:electron transport protein HydN [Rhodopseudomonas rhenobacensis]|uniref:Electron transport protein HydN n=1 Tax=Rhodopseudomonas rhenobacensis TaxID=87461 RepID=A0A7W7Z1D3_9BRAD|nr:4Fe-4S dicluster domain-containing protein [Rhodopseudomonas rhenobacensis]MBB5046225.1 electron transport protein HydN [Rhodopseudomonas rhenobacensis]
MNRFIVSEPNKCIGCHTCEVACALAHEPSQTVGALTPSHFTPRIKLMQTLTVSTPVTCHHCEEAPCLKACPSGAIYYNVGTVQIDQSRCLGCKTCVVACPFGVMEVITQPTYRSFAGVTVADGVKAEAHKCDLCINREKGPACVEVCPTDALHVMDEAMMAELQRERRLRSAINGGLTTSAGEIVNTQLTA